MIYLFTYITTKYINNGNEGGIENRLCILCGERQKRIIDCYNREKRNVDRGAPESR
jgi:hypothetical protein